MTIIVIPVSQKVRLQTFLNGPFQTVFFYSWLFMMSKRVAILNGDRVYIIGRGKRAETKFDSRLVSKRG